jgi:hypothetical protein
MSENIDTALVKGFETGVTLLAQQEGSRLRECVDVRMVGPGEEFSFDQLGIAEPQEITTRHADTPISDIEHDRRWVTPKTYARAELIDKPDALKSINDFTNPYLRAIALGMGRQWDRAIIDAALATARTGKTSGTSTESFDTGTNTIASGSVGMTLAKINEAAKILRKYEHPKPWFMVCAADQIEDLMNDSTMTSADYNSVRMLMAGDVNTFGGFTWKTTQLLDVDGTPDRTCLAWSKSSMLLAMLENPFSRITEESAKNYSTQVYYRSEFGSTRMQLRGVVDVQCTE